MTIEYIKARDKQLTAAKSPGRIKEQRRWNSWMHLKIKRVKCISQATFTSPALQARPGEHLYAKSTAKERTFQRALFSTDTCTFPYSCCIFFPNQHTWAFPSTYSYLKCSSIPFRHCYIMVSPQADIGQGEDQLISEVWWHLIYKKMIYHNIVCVLFI